MRYLLLLFFCQPLLFGCKKDTPEEPNPPVVLDTTPTYVPIYLSGDTAMGAAYAKKNTANWSAQGICKPVNIPGSNQLSILFNTFTQSGYLRESFEFGFIPQDTFPKTYALKSMQGSSLSPGFVSPFYGIFLYDGDVAGDSYQLDTTATDNRFTVEKIDHVNKRIECSFTVSFKIKEPRIQVINPKTVKFSNGRAWAVIQE